MKSKNIGYTRDDVVQAYLGLGLTKGDSVLVSSNLTALGQFEEREKTKILQAHYDSIFDIIGTKGTLIVPTFSFYLANTDRVFDLDESLCETGVFSEYVRNKKESIRSLHPFNSFTAVGHLADYICANNSSHAYGPESPADRMINNKVKAISIGLQPRRTCSLVHHTEFMIGVPYRYVKEFIQQVKVDKKITKQAFYQYVLYHEVDIKRDRNKKIFSKFSNDYTVKKSSLGRGQVSLYNLDEFYESSVQSFIDDMYIWLECQPIKRPYRQ